MSKTLYIVVALLGGNVLALVGVGAVLVVVDACEFGVVLGGAWNFAGELLEGLERTS